MNHKIKLFIHDSFFDSFSVLPKKIQKKTREFMKKFKENPSSSAINYEKIVTFIDQSLRTVRVDQKYRAIVQAPKEGNGYHLLWVDNHDEAMKWAEKKVFDWNKHTQSFQMYDKPETGTEVNLEEKAIIASATTLFEEYNEEDLTAIGTPLDLIPFVKGLKTMEALEKAQDNLPIDLYEYLYYLGEGIDLGEILEEINAGKSEIEEESANAKKHVYVITEDDELEEILSGDFEKWKIFLHPSQRALAYGDYKGPTKVTGGAGTGKTVCAVHRAKYMQNGLGAFDKPILFTTYTKSLTSYLQHTSKEFGLNEQLVRITNFDKLIHELAKDEKTIGGGYLNPTQEEKVWKEVVEYNPSRFDETFLMDEYNHIILLNRVESEEAYFKTSRIGRTARIGRKDKKDIWQLTLEFKKLKENNHTKVELCNLLTDHYSKSADKPFSHIVCDEVQDFSNPELSLMRALVAEAPNDMFLVGDPFQNIYGTQINFTKAGISVRGRRSKKLKVNYRTTDEIKWQAIKVIDQEIYENFDGEEESKKGYISLMHGNNPSYKIFSTPEEEDKYLIQNLQKLLAEGSSASHICISTRTNRQVELIIQLLTSNNIKSHDLGSTKQKADHIKVSTFHNLKGHEFKAIFVTGVSKDEVPFKNPVYNTYSALEKREYHKRERSLFYVVFSRAIQSLYITGVGEKSDWF
jgi:DNA helicase IV/mRNA-degrading endonuclease RelE of RelBE toxin-antitoxin system